MRKPMKPSIKWHSLLNIEDIQPRKSRYGTVYCLLYTNSGLAVCATEQIAQRLCLYEPYEMRGIVKPYIGGSYLKLDRCELFNPDPYRIVV